jgi:CubicO group peptidase (beta-lactamase class C family)
VNRPSEISSAVHGCRGVAARLCSSQQPPGLSVAVVAPGEQIWSDGFGVADIETRAQATADTVYL